MKTREEAFPMTEKRDLTKGNVTKVMLAFAWPMMLGNLLQQVYNIADTWIVGRYIGTDALGAVGSAYTLMTFLTSVLIGLCMGSGGVFSFYFGKGETEHMMRSAYGAFVLIGGITLCISGLIFGTEDTILRLLQVPEELLPMMQEYVHTIFYGLVFVFLYNYFAYFLRAVGNSVVPLYFLGGTAVLNVGLDLFFVVALRLGVWGAAAATVLSQAVSGVGIGIYVWMKRERLGILSRHTGSFFNREIIGELLRFSLSTSLQQSVMNFGILMIQGLVNSFGTTVMAAFAAAVKIDTFAYMPAQEFGNAFSLFVSQNHGAGKKERVKQGTRHAFCISVLFCLAVSAAVTLFAEQWMGLFISPQETAVLAVGKEYLWIEGAFYFGIGILFLLYGYYRGVNRPEISLLLTVISLGSRVLLAYLLAPVEGIGVFGIWWAIPIGWILADTVGIGLYKKYRFYIDRKE